MAQGIKDTTYRALQKFLGKGKPPDLGKLYSRTAACEHIDRNPVILIPGLLGSKLRDDDSGLNLWGTFGKDAASVQTPVGARLMSVPMQPDVSLQDIRDSVIPYKTLDHIKGNLLGMPVQLSAYSQILLTLGVGGFQDQNLADDGVVDYGNDHYTCFQYAYDWRRDLVEGARKLDRYINSRREFVQAKIEENYGIKDYDVKINLIAHSMGGLLLRYYLMFGNADLPKDGSIPEVTWKGAEHIGKAILIGTPSGGSIKMLQALLDGNKVAPGIPKFDPAVIGTMPATYQLLPRTRHESVVDLNDQTRTLDMFDIETWRAGNLGLLDPEQDKILQWILPDVSDQVSRREIALDHLDKILKRAKQFTQAMDQPSRHPSGLNMTLIAADSVPTNSKLGIDMNTGASVVLEEAPGDDSVTRKSALLDERTEEDWGPLLNSPVKWNNVFFIFSDHLGLTKHPMFTDNVLYQLLEHPD